MRFVTGNAICFCCLVARRLIGQFSPAMAMKPLDCAALKAEFDFAAELGENAPARRRHIRALQDEKQCVTPPKISISIGVSKSFN